MKYCEIVARLVCTASLHKADDYFLKGAVMSRKVCTNCKLYSLEDVGRDILRCHVQNEFRKKCSDISINLKLTLVKRY